MSLVQKILKELWDTELRHKGVRVNLFGIPRLKNYSPRSVRSTMDRLASQGIIEKEISGIVLSKYGKGYVQRKLHSLQKFNKPDHTSKERNLLVMFDMPIEKKAEREWFRFHLKKFGYKMIQHSVWVGPSPLPEEFLKYIKEIKLKSCIKTFKLAKGYNT